MSMSKTWILPAVVAAVAAAIVAVLDWNPPDWLFPIGWTLIYALNTAAVVSAWRAAPTPKVSDTIIGLFALNAFLNITWSMIFFRIQRPDWAFIEVLLLWLSILSLIIYCGRHSKASAALFMPYLIWVTFAGALNWAVVDLNGPFG